MYEKPKLHFLAKELLLHFLLIDHHLGQEIKLCRSRTVGQVKLNFPFSITSNVAEMCTRHISRSRVGLSGDWSFIGGSRIVVKPIDASCNLELVHIIYHSIELAVKDFEQNHGYI